MATGCDDETCCITETSLCCCKNNLASTGEFGAGKMVTAEGPVCCTASGDALELSKNKISHLSDTGLSTVGVKHCGEPEE